MKEMVGNQIQIKAAGGIRNLTEALDFINLGAGEDILIKDLVERVKAGTGFQGRVVWDDSKPDGMMRKCMDVSRLKALGWRPEISLESGIEKMIAEYRSLKAAGR